jgi:hypothetical protein
MAELIDMAGDGLPSIFWAPLARLGESPIEAGARRVRRAQGSFSYRDAVVVDHGAGAVAMLLGYPLPDRPKPVRPDLPAKFVPIRELEDLA